MIQLSALVFCIVSLSHAQAPLFRANSVVAGNRAVPLRPGLLMSIYGEHLGPAVGCEGRRMSTGYPMSLCDTRVLVGGLPSELLYVAAGQINFRVPERVGYEGTAKMEVVYKDKTSASVAMPLGPEPATVTLESAARVGGPVWLKVSGTEWARNVRYPFTIRPAEFGCNQVELRRNGRLIAPMQTLERHAVISIEGPMVMCGYMGLQGESRHAGSIPIHLLYRFESPGIYEVRLKMDHYARSPWTAIRILPSTAAERGRWLTNLSRHAPTDQVGLLTDYLPSILGIPDAQSLALVSQYAEHSDSLVSEFARNARNYYWQGDAGAKTSFGFDRNLYPGDAALPALRRTFAFTGYWLNSPPGDGASTWLGKRAVLKKNGFGFLILFNGRLYKDLRGVGAGARLGAADGAAAVQLARKEGFPEHAILFLDQEEGGRLVTEQLAYVLAWMDAVAKSGYGVGVYCSAIDVREGDGTVINTARQIREQAAKRRVHFFVYNDACPPSNGCAYPREAPEPRSSGIEFAEVWQMAQSPRRAALTARCASTYSRDLCLAPGSKLDIDLSAATSSDPSLGR